MWGFACPSCGLTSAWIQLLSGKVVLSVYTHPWVILVVIGLIVIPIWMLIDWFLKKQTLFHVYQTALQRVHSKKVYLPLMLLVLLTWIKNLFFST
jgi:hypothetical protein